MRREGECTQIKRPVKGLRGCPQFIQGSISSAFRRSGRRFYRCARASTPKATQEAPALRIAWAQSAPVEPVVQTSSTSTTRSGTTQVLIGVRIALASIGVVAPGATLAARGHGGPAGSGTANRRPWMPLAPTRRRGQCRARACATDHRERAPARRPSTWCVPRFHRTRSLFRRCARTPTTPRAAHRVLSPTTTHRRPSTCP